MATNQNFLLVAVSSGYQLKITVGIQELRQVWVFSKIYQTKFLLQEKSSTELKLNVP